MQSVGQRRQRRRWPFLVAHHRLTGVTRQQMLWDFQVSANGEPTKTIILNTVPIKPKKHIYPLE